MRRPAADVADDVVIGKRKADPAVGGLFLRQAKRVAEMAGRVFAAEVIEGVAHVQLVIARSVLGHDFELVLGIADFANGSGAGILVEQRAHALEEGDIFRLALVVEVFLKVVGINRGRGGCVVFLGADGRVVFKPLGVEIEVDRIEPEAIDAAFEPETHFAQQGILDGGVVEIEIGLGDKEVVQVILHAPAVPMPAGTAKDREPVVGRAAIGLGVGPDVPIGLFIGARKAAFGEPGVAVGRVRDHLIDDDFQAQRMGLFQQPVEIFERAESRIDVAIIGDVVAEVLHGRGKDRGEPDGIDPQIGDIFEPRCDAHQIAYAIGVVILKRARVNLVDHRAAPPVPGGGRRIFGMHELT